MSGHTRVTPAADDTRWRHRFLERATGSMGTVNGLPPSFMRVYCWLLVCEPPEQSVADLRQALGLSAGAVSSATATLIRMGVIERISQAGDRRHWFRIQPGGWERLLRVRLQALTAMSELIDEALATAPGPQTRLSELQDVSVWFEQRIAELLVERDRSH